MEPLFQVTFIASLVLFTLFPPHNHASPSPGITNKRLQFNSDGKFKIVQFTDLHFGESYDKDMKTLAAQGTVLTEENPDLVVITGDLVSGYAWNKQDINWYYKSWVQLISPMVEREIRWAIALGNHDMGADLTAAEIIALDSSHELSLTQRGPETISGAEDIPVYEFIDLWNSKSVYGDLKDDAGVCCPSVNTGMYNAMKEMNDIKHVYCGHDHSNDYYGDYYGITLGYGRKTGYGSYGPPSGWQHGARVLEISDNGEVNTWLRLEDGSMTTQSKREGPASLQWVGCCKMDGRKLEVAYSTQFYILFGIEGGIVIGIAAASVVIYRKYKKAKGYSNEQKYELESLATSIDEERTTPSQY